MADKTPSTLFAMCTPTSTAPEPRYSPCVHASTSTAPEPRYSQCVHPRQQHQSHVIRHVYIYPCQQHQSHVIRHVYTHVNSTRATLFAMCTPTSTAPEPRYSPCVHLRQQHQSHIIRGHIIRHVAPEQQYQSHNIRHVYIHVNSTRATLFAMCTSMSTAPEPRFSPCVHPCQQHQSHIIRHPRQQHQSHVIRHVYIHVSSTRATLFAMCTSMSTAPEPRYSPCVHPCQQHQSHIIRHVYIHVNSTRATLFAIHVNSTTATLFAIQVNSTRATLFAMCTSTSTAPEPRYSPCVHPRQQD